MIKEILFELNPSLDIVSPIERLDLLFKSSALFAIRSILEYYFILQFYIPLIYLCSIYTSSSEIALLDLSNESEINLDKKNSIQYNINKLLILLDGIKFQFLCLSNSAQSENKSCCRNSEIVADLNHSHFTLYFSN